MANHMVGENLRSIGSNIRKWRNVKGVKQLSLAKAMGISKGTLSRIENGKADISIQNLQKIAAILNIGFPMLMTDPSNLLHSLTDKA